MARYDCSASSLNFSANRPTLFSEIRLEVELRWLLLAQLLIISASNAWLERWSRGSNIVPL